MDERPPVVPRVTPSARFEPHKRAAQFVTPQAPPDAHHDRVLYGLMQPVVGARTLVTDGNLLRSALMPAGLLAGFSLLVAVVAVDGWSPRAIVKHWYETLVALAPLPSLFLARYYARLAVVARHKFGFAKAEPCIEPLGYAFKRLVKQTILIAIGLVPVSILLHMVPLVGPLILKALAAVWALHWIVVDAFDSARTLAPGQTLAQLDAEALHAPRPWFTRLLAQAGDRVPVLGAPLRWFARRLDKLAMPWREEAALIEAHPSLMAGFALSTALFVATPILNLLFRPIIIIGASHVLGHLELAQKRNAVPVAAPSTPPAPAPPSTDA